MSNLVPPTATCIKNIRCNKVHSNLKFNDVGGRACIEQSFGRCHHFCRENQVQTINYECYCEKGYILQGNFDCLAVGECVLYDNVGDIEFVFTFFLKGGNPEIFISNLTEIARVMVLGSTYSSLLHLDNITAFDYNYEKAVSKILYKAHKLFICSLFFPDTLCCHCSRESLFYC